jgi:hypothetical protein
MLTSMNTLASEPVVLREIDAQILGTQIEYIEDVSGELTIADVAGGNLTFKTNKTDDISFGVSSSAFWLRFSLRNDSKRVVSRIIEFDDPLIDKIRLYVPGDDGFEIKHGGRLAAVSGDTIFHAFPALVVNVLPQQTRTYYVRIESTATLIFKMRLWDLISFSERQLLVFVFLGLYFGAILAIVFYEMIVFWMIRSKTRGYYVAYLLGLTIFQAMLMLPNSEFSWSDQFWWPAQILLFLAGTCMLLSVQFARSTLNSALNAPKSDIGLIVLMVISWLIIGGSFSLSRIPFYLTHLAAILGPLWVMGTVLVCVSQGVRAARFMAVAWPIYLLGIVLFGLSNLGYLPRNFLTDHAMKIGFMISTILFSNALADQAKVETRRIRAELEKLVSIRTTDLETRTAELEFALENIKSLKGLIPICASCKNVRDDEGFWTQVELYIRDRSEAEFSHGICPACAEKLYGKDITRQVD